MEEIVNASPAPNIYKSLKKIARDYKLIIVSHKTKFPYIGPKYNLHEGALNWLEKINSYQ